MEEDSDDFLGGVIEFGDGKQYKVEAALPSDQPVAKQDRFVDDFDRSWPKSNPSSPPQLTSPALSTRPTSTSTPHPRLFNERSNKLEPYNHRPPSPPRPPKSVQFLHKPEWSSRSNSTRGPHPPKRSDMAPPLHAPRRPSQDTPSLRPPPRIPTSPIHPSSQPPPLPAAAAASQAPPSPPLSHTSSLLSPHSLIAVLPATTDLNEVTKDLMQSAAQRAKVRKFEEEKEREAQKERARRKALQLEEKMKDTHDKDKSEKDTEARQLKVCFLILVVCPVLISLPGPGERGCLFY